MENRKMHNVNSKIIFCPFDTAFLLRKAFSLENNLHLKNFIHNINMYKTKKTFKWKSKNKEFLTLRNQKSKWRNGSYRINITFILAISLLIVYIKCKKAECYNNNNLLIQFFTQSMSLSNFNRSFKFTI